MIELMEPPISEERKTLFMTLYKKTFPVVASYIKKRGGSLDDAKDIFQESLVVYYEKQLKDTGTIRSTPEAYILGVVKHLWSKKYHSGNKESPLNDNMEIPQNADEITEPSPKKILEILEASGRKCLNLLQEFYYNQLKMEDIARKFEFSSIRSATVQKYKCLEKVRNIVKEKSIEYEDFTGRD